MDRPDDLDRLAADWIALWESELSALGQDAELAEAWASSVAMMAAFWRAQGSFLSAQMAWRAHDPAAPRPAPLAPAPDARRGAGHGGDDDAAPGTTPSTGDATLRARLAELEQRLAALEGGPGGGGTDRPVPRKPRARRGKP
ncbi:hypothetical protein [Roseococcus sp.]|uniref:hypothetical protein n=1 Tax=Roseococcus sp. TaxID=2109646 RepID=UPI003BAD2CB1